MIIPVKCFTCGKVLGDTYLYYIQEVTKEKLKKSDTGDEVVYLTEKNANEDFLNQSRIILGGDKHDTEIAAKLYRWRFQNKIPIVQTNFQLCAYTRRQSSQKALPGTSCKHLENP